MGMLAPISDRCGTGCAYFRQNWECLRLFETDMGTSLRLFEADVGQLAPICGRCGINACAYLRQIFFLLSSPYPGQTAGNKHEDHSREHQCHQTLQATSKSKKIKTEK